MKKNILLILSLLVIILVTGCVKDPIDPGYARFMIINTVPDLSGIDCYVDNEKQNVLSIGFGSNTVYNGITPGQRGITITPAGTKNVFKENIYSVANTPLKLATYTFLALNRTSAAELLWIEDDLTLPAAGKAHLRIIHAGPDAPRVNAFVGAATTPIFSAAATGFGYKEFSSFVPIDATSLGTSYSIQLRNTSTNAIVRTQPMTAVAGKIYTIVLRGLVTADPAFPLNTISSTLVGNN